MTETHWLTLEEAARIFGVPYKHLWDLIMGRAPGAKRLAIYRLPGGSALYVRKEDLFSLLGPVTDPDELAELEQRPPRPKLPDHLF